MSRPSRIRFGSQRSGSQWKDEDHEGQSEETCEESRSEVDDGDIRLVEGTIGATFRVSTNIKFTNCAE